jgi:hypothetical protein
MRWGDYRRSDNVEDRTGNAPEGGGGGLPFGGMRLGGGALIILVIVGMLFGINPFEMLGMLGGGDGGSIQVPPSQTAPPGYGPQPQAVERPGASGPADVNKDFSARVLGDTEDVWTAIFKQSGQRYEPPKLVLFRGMTRSACGRANAAVGPFYCPADRDLYLDTSFFNELKSRFGAPGEFAQAYVIAHEVGHHVQKLLGIMDQVEAVRQRMDSAEANALQVRVELQADCFAGVWANHAQESKNIIEPGDIEEALNAASAIGDDRIQRQTQGYVVPDAFTHGSSAQRVRWFKRGYESGKLESCDTFNTDQL